MGAGRFACVALPIALTIASIVCILIAMLAGVTDKSLSLFTVDTANLSMSSSTIANLVDARDAAPEPSPTLHGLGDLTNEALNTASSIAAGDNITASTLGLADEYKVSIWAYCAVTGGKANCTGMKFDWASSELNATALTGTAGGQTVTVNLPSEVRGALKTFIQISKWTQVVYIIALVAAAIVLVCGLFAICSRLGSCCTSIIAGIATAAITIASVMATVQASVVVGALKSTAKMYGVDAEFNTRFLAVTWLAVAFSLGAGLFWLFSMCCCASDHKSSKNKSSLFSKRRSHADDSEKLIPTGAYQRVGDEHHGYAGQQQGIYNNAPEYGVPMHNVKPAHRGNGAYEPYAHTAI